jgi:hypothetical protein
MRRETLGAGLVLPGFQEPALNVVRVSSRLDIHAAAWNNLGRTPCTEAASAVFGCNIDESRG